MAKGETNSCKRLGARAETRLAPRLTAHRPPAAASHALAPLADPSAATCDCDSNGSVKRSAESALRDGSCCPPVPLRLPPAALPPSLPRAPWAGFSLLGWGWSSLNATNQARNSHGHMQRADAPVAPPLRMLKLRA
eukprot:359469-Chlamydomonas_euryale.AAC.8